MTATAVRPSDVSAGRMLQNTAVNAVANAGGALITLVMTPFLLHHLGPAQYGIWLLALTLTFSNGYLALADLGLPEAAVKFIAEARARDDVKTINEVASTITAVFVGVGLVAGTALVLLAGVVTRIFDVDPALSGTARLVFVLMALGIVADLPAAGLLSVIEGAQHYAWLRSIDIGTRLAWAGLVILAVEGGHGVVSLAVASIVTTSVAAAAAVVAAHRVQPGLRLRPRLATRKTLRRTFGYGSAVAVLRLLSVVYAQMDRVIVGAAVGLVAVAGYEVAFRVQSVATMVMVVAGSAVLPAAAYTAARADSDTQRELYLRGTKYAVALIVPVTLGALVYARAIIVTWVGSTYATMAGASRLFLIYPLFGCLNQVAVPMLLGVGRVRRVLVLQVVAVTINLGLSIALAPHYGINGVIIGTLVGNAVVFVPYTRLFLASFEVSGREWVRRVVAPNVLGPAVQLAFCLATLGWVEGLGDLWAVGAVWAFSCAVCLTVFAATGLGAVERRRLLNQLRHGG